MGRAEETAILCCPLTDLEQDLAAEMLRLTGLDSGANLARLGLWHLAKHLDVPVGAAFGPRRTRGVRAQRRLMARQLRLEDIA